MAGKLKHRFVSPVADEGVTTEVGPVEWNDSLVLSEGAEGDVPVRRTALADGWELIKLGSAPLWVKSNDANNSGTGETDLHSYTIPASHFNVTNRIIKLTAWGVFAANANVKTVRARFGGGTAIVLNPVTASPNGTRWKAEVWIVRTGTNAQRVFFNSMVALLFETNGLVLKITGQSGTASNDITQQGSMVEYYG